MDDGTEFVCKPGDVSVLPSGHDAWVVGNENVVIVDFQGMKKVRQEVRLIGAAQSSESAGPEGAGMEPRPPFPVIRFTKI